MGRAPSASCAARRGRRWSDGFSVEEVAVVVVVPVAAERGSPASESLRRRGCAGVDVEVVRQWGVE